VIGLDRDRSFFATVMLCRYLLRAFRCDGSVTPNIENRIVIASGFFLFAVIGFKGNLWLVAAVIFGGWLAVLLLQWESFGIPAQWIAVPVSSFAKCRMQRARASGWTLMLQLQGPLLPGFQPVYGQKRAGSR
jgi:hypothetical protein